MQVRVLFIHTNGNILNMRATQILFGTRDVKLWICKTSVAHGQVYPEKTASRKIPNF